MTMTAAMTMVTTTVVVVVTVVVAVDDDGDGADGDDDGGATTAGDRPRTHALGVGDPVGGGVEQGCGAAAAWAPPRARVPAARGDAHCGQRRGHN